MGVLNKMNPIGALDRRITLKTLSYTQDAYGEPDASVASSEEVWGHIKWLKGKEDTEGFMESNNPEFVIVIRYKSNVTEDTIVAYDGDDYDITYIKETGRRRYLHLTCVKREV